MDKTIRRNENCVIGLPRCDFVFSSTRSCFIAYGFEESTLEMTVLRNLLESCGIQPIEAGGSFASGQNIYCSKICSKIITSQFCIVLLNNSSGKNGDEIPNANVNMEYGLMLGFNKYVIPFQRNSQRLPFNVAGLDTIKYTDSNLESKAKSAIESAINTTNQDNVSIVKYDQIVQTFLLSKNMLFTSIDNQGDKNILNLGSPLDFNLINDFSGMKYAFLGCFSSLRPELVLWRIQKLNEIINGRTSTIDTKISLGLCTEQEANAATELFNNIQIWVIVTSENEKKFLDCALQRKKIKYQITIYSNTDVNENHIP